MTRVKFCGMTSPADVAAAVDAGADAIGVIVADSERRVTLEQAAEIARAVPPFVAAFAVVGDGDAASAGVLRSLGYTLQFAGPTPPRECVLHSAGRRYVKVLHVAPDGSLDPGIPATRRATTPTRCSCSTRRHRRSSAARARPSPGRSPANWHASARSRSPAASPANVGDCVRALRPFAVDVRSGIEREGRKDPTLMRDFVRAVRHADATA